MKKAFEYNLNVTLNENFLNMPALHDFEVEKIEFKDNLLTISSIDFKKHDYDYFDIVGFHPKKVIIEFISKELLESNVTMSKYCPKKQIKEKEFDGFGKKSNCYDIEEFVKLSKKLKLEILYNMVSYRQVNILFASYNENVDEIEIAVYCDKVKYIFTN